MDCVLLKNRSLVFAVGLGPEIDSRVCLWVVARVGGRLLAWVFSSMSTAESAKRVGN
jgi:hypothetical protein